MLTRFKVACENGKTTPFTAFLMGWRAHRDWISKRQWDLTHRGPQRETGAHR